MALKTRPFQGAADLDAMVALVQAFPKQTLHVIDLPLRLCSWALNEPRIVGLRFNASDTLRAWVVLQTPFWCIDLIVMRAFMIGIPRELLEAAVVDGAGQ